MNRYMDMEKENISSKADANHARVKTLFENLEQLKRTSSFVIKLILNTHICFAEIISIDRKVGAFFRAFK